MRRRAGWLAGVTGLALLVAGCAGLVSDDESGAGDDVRRGISIVEPQDRIAGPEIVGADLEGGSVDVSNWRGKVVVINVWGSWCPPCRVETPELNKVALENADDVEFLGIAVRESATASLAFARKFDVPYPSISDPSSALLTRFAEPLPAVAIPTTYVLDRQGRVAVRVLDRITYATLSALIEDVQADETTQP
jgi:thiol-disulfide isomerase/thioredoxin